MKYVSGASLRAALFNHGTRKSSGGTADEYAPATSTAPQTTMAQQTSLAPDGYRWYMRSPCRIPHPEECSSSHCQFTHRRTCQTLTPMYRRHRYRVQDLSGHIP
eukprot:11522976-Alexandrium_andersonii.AAC.1